MFLHEMVKRLNETVLRVLDAITATGLKGRMCGTAPVWTEAEFARIAAHLRGSR